MSTWLLDWWKHYYAQLLSAKRSDRWLYNYCSVITSSIHIFSTGIFRNFIATCQGTKYVSGLKRVRAQTYMLLPRHHCDRTIIACQDRNVTGHKRVCSQMCVGTNVCGHKRVFSQMCVGTNMCFHKRVWAQSCVGTNMCGPKRVWAQTCVGTNVCGHKHVWA